MYVCMYRGESLTRDRDEFHKKIALPRCFVLEELFGIMCGRLVPAAPCPLHTSRHLPSQRSRRRLALCLQHGCFAFVIPVAVRLVAVGIRCVAGVGDTVAHARSNTFGHPRAHTWNCFNSSMVTWALSHAHVHISSCASSWARIFFGSSKYSKPIAGVSRRVLCATLCHPGLAHHATLKGFD